VIPFFWALILGIAIGVVIGGQVRRRADRSPRSVRRAHLAARADLRRVLPSRIWWWR